MGNKEMIVIDYLSQPEVFAELFNGYVFDGKQVIQPEDLRETDGRLRFLLTDIESKEKKSTYSVFYEKQGYRKTGNIDLEEDCPHIWMYKQL